MEHPWLLARTREVQKAPDGYLDLWARGHYKSTVITFAKTIQDILGSHGDDPLPEFEGLELTFGIFSHTRPIAKAFLRQIRDELAKNELLQYLFPDILYENPERDAPRWSEDSGIVVKRKSNPKEATVEAWGLVDGQPTSKHFNVLIWDDCVTRDSVTTPEMIMKTTESWQLSMNVGDRSPRKRMIGTRYHFADTYRTVIEGKSLEPRVYPATDDGTLKGNPVFLTQAELDAKIRDMGPYVSGAQLMQNPTVDSKQTFKREWFEKRFNQHEVGWRAMNRALLCDPANSKNKRSDYTTMAVIGKGPDQNVYLLDFLRDRLTLQERANEYLRLHRKWAPQKSGYEEYGLQADIDYLKERQNRETYRFEIEKLAGALSKADRINRLIPLAADGKLWLPDTIYRTNSEGKLEELVLQLIETEFLPWPVPVHDDGLDVISRLFDLESFLFPMSKVPAHKDDRYNMPKRAAGASWMGR